MKFDPDKHHRRTIRLPGYDYGCAGAYFVTVCTRNRECLFGEVSDGKMVLNQYGKIVSECWQTMTSHFSNISSGEFVVMPNHVHGILLIADDAGETWATHESPLQDRPLQDRPLQEPSQQTSASRPRGPARQSISVAIGLFKAAAAKRINAVRDTSGLSIWQRNYYEHIIRDETELAQKHDYIEANPSRWAQDEENVGEMK